ncbi:hypothetical protein KW868_15485 [Acinetobacter guillouiae]|uniref:Uncharacterized protein n=1 Tax=Acinetobacter guillouiae TaxID=106649 RepID=A0A8X8GGQ8_ACIGI|nr:hypothetical protein [Acinetobacter guillouiae]
MDLIHCLQRIDQYSSEEILFVEEPWAIEANIQIIPDDQSQTVLDINGKKYTYFLEIFIINELLEEFSEKNMTLEEKCRRIIEYAINDA